MLPKMNENSHPTSWFEDIYKNSDITGSGVPWANMQVHPFFVDWLKENDLKGIAKKALVPGCGLGDDALELESRGFDVTAFDVSSSAIELVQKRFPLSKTTFVEADLFNPPKQWKGFFDFIFEVFTIQALPPQYEKETIKNLSSFVAPTGRILVVTAVSDEERDIKNGPPWLLTQDHIQHFVGCGLTIEKSELRKGLWSGRDICTTVFKRP